MIKHILSELGLPPKEISVYACLSKLGSAKASVISKEVKLPRQTTYSILNQLVKKGFVMQADLRGVRRFGIDPKQLSKMIVEKKNRLEKARQSLENQSLAETFGTERIKTFPKVHYYEGSEGMKRLLNNILEIYKKGKSKKFRGYGINYFYGSLESFLQNFVKERYGYGVKTNLFIANAPDNFNIVDEKSALGRTVKHLDMEEQKAALYLVANRAYLFSYADNVGVMIENQAIIQLLKDVFDDHWEKSKN